MNDAAGGGGPEQLVTITEDARVRLVQLLAQQADEGRPGLRLRVAAIDDDHYHHDLRFDSVTKAALSDVICAIDGLKVIVAAADVALLRGAVVDYTPDDGLVVRNPNTPSTVAGDAVLIDDDELSCQVRDVVSFEVNPMLASHGGFVEFAGHDGRGTAYLTMGGGCQGCSLSASTMRDGVRGMLAERVPAIQRVQDITDHAAGERPYFHE
jgi:Fe/S biogenesis protein NfuA